MESAQSPIVAIVGRPNVGKSTLFNRYAGHRRALVDDLPGVTRDRVAEEIEVSGRRVLLVDTAGLDPDADSGIDVAVQAQAQAAVEGADAILLVVDGRAGRLPQDEELARTLRRTDKPVALAVNKLDAPMHDDQLADFYALGIDLLGAVSAEHGRGAWDLLEALEAQLGRADEPIPEPDEEPSGGFRIAIVGRPNVGKSSLLNRLIGSERVVVSDEPGTTRDSVDITVERDGVPIVFVDTAGIRRAGRRKERVERGSAVMTLRAIERAHVALVLIDAEEGFTDQDARVLSLVRERGCACAVLVNKWDLIEAQDDERGQQRLEDEIARRLRPVKDVPVLRISAVTGRGIKRIWKTAERLRTASMLKISTPALNRWLQDCVHKHEPAMAQSGTRKRPLKFFYATQTAVRPPTLLIFCTEPDAVQRNYKRFLENQLREQFDLAGVPVRLRLRKRGPDGDD